MNESIPISIICASFNSSQTIGHMFERLALLRCLFEEKNFHLEILVIDGKSSDNSDFWFDIYFDIIDCLVIEADEGVYDAFNKGLALSRGKFVYFANSDDLIVDIQFFIDVATKIINSETISVIYYGNVIFEEKKYGPVVMDRFWKSDHYKVRRILYWMPPHPAQVGSLQWILSAGGFRSGYQISGDFDLFLRLQSLEGFKAIWLDRTVSHMSLGGLSNRGFKSRMRSLIEDERALRDKTGFFFRLMAVIVKRISKFGQLGLYVRYYWW